MPGHAPWPLYWFEVFKIKEVFRRFKRFSDKSHVYTPVRKLQTNIIKLENALKKNKKSSRFQALLSQTTVEVFEWMKYSKSIWVIQRFGAVR